MPEIPEWALTAIAVLVGAAAAWLQRRGNVAALEASESITRQLVAVIEGVELAGKKAPGTGVAFVKRAVQNAAMDAGVNRELAARVRKISEMMK